MAQHRIRHAVVASIVGGGLVIFGLSPAGPMQAGAAPGSADPPSVTGTPGLGTRVTPTPNASFATKGARRTAVAAAGAAAAQAAAVPAAPATTAGTISAADTRNRLLRSFDGTSSRDSQFTNYNLMFEPPDQGLCVGNGFVLEPVNSAYRIFRTDGTSVRGPFNINDLFNEGGKEFTSDPRCWYDPQTRSWFAVILFLNDTFTRGRIDIAVNPTPDPTGLWSEYQIDTTNAAGPRPGCPCFGDQPRLGIDQTNLYVTTDEFSINGPQFYGGQIYAISKADLLRGTGRLHFVHFANLHIGGALGIAPQPALSIGNPDAEYFLSSLDPAGAGDNRIGVWAMTDREKVSTGGSPTLSKVVIGSERYSNPPLALQKGSTSKIESNDDRMQQASFVGGTVWGELDTAIRPAGDTTVRAGAAWFQVRPHLTGKLITGATLVRQGYVAKKGEYLLMPALQPDAAGNAAMVFTETSRAMFPSASFAVLLAGAANFGPPVVAAAGTGPYDPTATRWGDYSFAVPDWTSDAAWLATEYMPPRSSQTTTGRRNWGTRVMKVRLG